MNKTFRAGISALCWSCGAVLLVGACASDVNDTGDESATESRGDGAEAPGVSESAFIADPIGCNDLHGGNFCGGQNPFSECWCDEACETTFFDCCSDKGATCGGDTGSCQGFCGGFAQGQSCWCDSLCHSFGDCCPDKVWVCGQ
jgi:hypothetical protein